MPISKENKEKRDKKILERYRELRKKNPKFTIVAILQQVAQEFDLNPTTIGKVIKKSGQPVPDTKTIAKYSLPSFCQYTLS